MSPHQNTQVWIILLYFAMQPHNYCRCSGSEHGAALPAPFRPLWPQQQQRKGLSGFVFVKMLKTWAQMRACVSLCSPRVVVEQAVLKGCWVQGWDARSQSHFLKHRHRRAAGSHLWFRAGDLAPSPCCMWGKCYKHTHTDSQQTKPKLGFPKVQTVTSRR